MTYAQATEILTLLRYIFGSLLIIGLILFLIWIKD